MISENALVANELLRWRAYLGLCKLKVVALIVFTAMVGMLLATPSLPPLDIFLFGSLGIALAAASAAAINHVVDQHIDSQMYRTSRRPLPSGELNSRYALNFALIIGSLSMLILTLLVNLLTAMLTFASLIGYAVIYTLFLKRMTPQNIVIGGAAGAAPPVLGWTAVTGQVEAEALLLFLLIFVWTPPHFWALAIHRQEEYARADIPMLPVTHGVDFTRLHILLYTILLCLISLLPWLIQMSGLLYLFGAIVLDSIYLYYVMALYYGEARRFAMPAFVYSIYYLMGMFFFLMVDHYFFTHHMLSLS